MRVLLVGAWARDLCLPSSARGEPRKTNDADLAVLVDGWEAIDTLLDAAAAEFDVQRSDLILRHRQLGVKVDVVPCGNIEEPIGELHLRGSTRVLNTVGLAASFETAKPHAIGTRTVLIPRPSAYVLLKLLSYLDRRAPRDLRDLGYVATRNPYDPDTIWDDEATRNGLADHSIFHEDLAVWFLGQDLKRTFDPPVVRVFQESLEMLAGMDLWPRSQVMSHLPNTAQRVEKADRLIEVLLTAVQ